MSRRGYWLPKDAAGVPIQVGGGTNITDANGSVSPQAVVTATATGSRTQLVVPNGAVQFHFCPDQIMWVSPDASALASHGIKVPADTERTFNVKDGDKISAIASVAGTLSYHFTMLDGDGD